MLQEEQSASATSGAGEQRAAPSGRVLLAEDDRDLRDLLATLLREHGYAVEELAGPEELEQRVASMPAPGSRRGVPDLLVYGLGSARREALPSIDRVRTWQGPVVLLSAFADEALIAHALHRGAFAVLALPFSLEAFLGVVRRAVASAREPRRAG
jgi:DNA-binding response OmpR family regulator